MKKITEQTFYKYLKCPSWVARELAQTHETRDRVRELLQDEGLLAEQGKVLLKDKDLVEVNLDDIDESAVRTVELMKKGVSVIYKGALVYGHWVGEPDILERVEGKSIFGNWYYVAIDIKRSRHLKDEYKFQGAFYAEILKKIQGTKPMQGYILHADGSNSAYSHHEFETKFHLTLDEIERILEGEKPSHFLTSACKQSPWFSECKDETIACGDLSLINRIWKSEVDELKQADITTVTELANAPLSKIETVRGLTMDRLYFLQQQAISLSDNRVIRLGEIELPEEDESLIIDIESDPLRDSDYLFGVLHVKNGKDKFHAFLAKDPKDEGKAWKKFVAFLEEHADLSIYHYGWYEHEVFTRMTKKYGAPEIVKKQFDEKMIDLIVLMREKVIFPLPFYSLKDIAKYLGFTWRIKEASGLESVIWYHDWIKTQDKTILQNIVDYNEDDVRATWFLRNWIIKGD